MTFPGNAGLLQSKGETVDSMRYQYLPVQMGELFFDDEEDLSQFMVGQFRASKKRLNTVVNFLLPSFSGP